MNKKEIFSKIRSKEVQDFLKGYGVQHMYLFGSYSQNTNTAQSDIDLLYELQDSKIGYRDFLNLKTNLEKYLQKKVDLVDTRYINKHYAPSILKEKEQVF